MSAGEECAHGIGGHGQEQVATINERSAARNPIALGGITQVFRIWCDFIEVWECVIIAAADRSRDA